MKHSSALAYIVGVSLGDGNLSRPNGRATRLRITCDASYPKLAEEIETELRELFPSNVVSRQPAFKQTYFNISVYSNKLDEIMPWKVGMGSKFQQNAHIPNWIKENQEWVKSCLRGLIQTDGSIYTDRGYPMVNFTNNTESLATDTFDLIKSIGYEPRLYKAKNPSGTTKYTVRVSKDVHSFIADIKLKKQ